MTPLRPTNFENRVPFSTDRGMARPLVQDILTSQPLHGKSFIGDVLKRLKAFEQAQAAVPKIPLPEGGGPKKRMLILSVSDYRRTGGPSLDGSRTDWRLWSMLGGMAGWNTEVVADSLPVSNPSSFNPTRENIWKFSQYMLKNNRKGDQFVLVYSGHGDKRGLVLGDGSVISREELRSWFVDSLAPESFLWAFFDCCESNNMLGLSTTRSSPSTLRDATVICIGSSAESCGEMKLVETSPSSAPMLCGPLAWAMIECFQSRWRGLKPPPLDSVLRVMEEVFKGLENGQKPQVTTSAVVKNPTPMPMLAPLKS